MLSLSVRMVIYLISALVYKPLNSIISIMLGRTLKMPSLALLENSFWDFFFFLDMVHERFGDLFTRLYLGKSPHDLVGILISVKTRIYMTHASEGPARDKWAGTHFSSLGRRDGHGQSLQQEYKLWQWVPGLPCSLKMLWPVGDGKWSVPIQAFLFS